MDFAFDGELHSCSRIISGNFIVGKIRTQNYLEL